LCEPVARRWCRCCLVCSICSHLTLQCSIFVV